MSECHTFPLDKKPFCPECYLKWVEDNVPQGKIVKQQIAVPTEIIKEG